jgi:hypothetical protein
MNKTDTNDPVTLDNTRDKVFIPSKIDLKSIDDVRLEMGKIYRQMMSREIETSDGTKLLYVLAQISKMDFPDFRGHLILKVF